MPRPLRRPRLQTLVLLLLLLLLALLLRAKRVTPSGPDPPAPPSSVTRVTAFVKNASLVDMDEVLEFYQSFGLANVPDARWRAKCDALVAL